MKKKESILATAVLRYLNSLPGAFFFKHHGGPYSKAGVSDIIGTYKGRFVAIELKTGKNIPTTLQEIFQARVIANGGDAYVIYRLDEVKKLFPSPLE